MTESHTAHIPIMTAEVVQLLAPTHGDIIFDGTVGGGGHMQQMLPHIGETGRYIACDADESALERLQQRIHDTRIAYVHGNFRNVDMILQDLHLPYVQSMLLDLGISSDQLTGVAGEGSGRGFSFSHDEPLTMTLAANPHTDTLMAHDIVNTWSEETLADVIYGFGEERRARAIARAIVAAREEGEIASTGSLAAIIARRIPRTGKTHPATKTFQALRIAVNDELGALAETLSKAHDALAQEGKIAIITFHSLEDRVVKRTFKQWEAEGRGTVLTKKPIAPSRYEVTANPRARSAKLRCFRTT
jgi:16S rRNA (cytosine1402-N4)-methyltransferase